MRRHKLTKTLKFLGLGILALTTLAGVAATYVVRRSWPQETGTIKVPGLQDRVEVFRDAWGIPHIYASNQHDLFMAQGYIHAQDRFWQMDYWRHIGSGRLAEMFGKSQVDTDKFLRTLGWARIAQQELSQSDPNTIAILQAYADGVNAYLGDRHSSKLSLEHSVLQLLNPNYQPKPWQPLHTLTWVKVMAWDLSTSLETEIQHAILRKTLTPVQVNELFPPYPADRPIIVPTTTIRANSTSLVSHALVPPLSPALKPITKQLDTLSALYQCEMKRSRIEREQQGAPPDGKTTQTRDSPDSGIFGKEPVASQECRPKRTPATTVVVENRTSE